MDSVDAGNPETEAMHAALRRIAAEVISDADQAAMDDAMNPELSTTVMNRTRSCSPAARSLSRSASRSPVRCSLSPRQRSRSPGFADSTFCAVEAALNKRQIQVRRILVASKTYLT